MFAALTLGCGGGSAAVLGPDAPNAEGVACDVRAYSDGAVALSERWTRETSRREDLDPDLALADRLRQHMAFLDGLLVLDRIRVACGVVVPRRLWARALRGRMVAVNERVTCALDERTLRVDVSDAETLEGPLLDPRTRRLAERATEELSTAVRTALAQRSDVLAAAVDEPCVRDRLADVEAWRDRIRSLEPGPARTEAENIAHAIGWSATQVPAALDVEALEDVLGDELEERRRHTLDVVTRCPDQVPPELLPRAGS